MSEHLYFPLIKTRDSELRAFGNLSLKSQEAILPIYELTKSRKTNKTPDGDIYRRMKQIEEIQGGRPFILDLCTDEKYINPQIEQLLSENDGFNEWYVFLFELHSDLAIIPMIHLYEDDEGVSPSVEEFVRRASGRTEHLAVRIPYDLDEIEYYLSPIIRGLGNSPCKLYVVLDAEYIRDSAEGNMDRLVNTFVDSAQSVSDYLGAKLEDVVMMCSSFPSSVTVEAEKNGASKAIADYEGEFPVYEELLYQAIRKQFPIKYGDYASINNQQIEIRGGTFVPRIDVSLIDEESFIYKRYRRDQGSYTLCAQKMLDDGRYSNINSWADSEIELAAAGEPTGISPSFWISVRMVYYIESRVLLRLSD